MDLNQMLVFARVVRSGSFTTRVDLLPGTNLIDVDDLKLVNDTFGHACGDELLQVVANLLVEQARATDAVVRSGGDEFFVVLDQPDAKGGAQLAERIRIAVTAIAAATEKQWLRRLGLSIGYAATAEGLAVEHLIARADQRLYEDKRHKR